MKFMSGNSEIQNRKSQIAKSLSHSLVRNLNRAQSTSLGGHFPDHSAIALRAFRRVVRAHRKLMKLAPEFFDAGIVDYHRWCREEAEKWMASWEPALEKVYGPSRNSDQNENRCNSGAEIEQNPNLAPYARRQPRSAADDLVIECELAQCRDNLRLGSDALQFFQKHQSRRLPSFTRMAGLLDVAFDLARLACGAETNLPPDARDPSDHSQVLADLHRAYGAEETGSAPAPGAVSRALAADTTTKPPGTF